MHGVYYIQSIRSVERFERRGTPEVETNYDGSYTGIGYLGKMRR